MSVIFSVLADVVLILHLLFLAFVGFGAFAVLRWPGLMWFHIPVVLWGAAIEFLQFPCPLTPLENILRRRGGEAGYEGGFIDHYLMPVIYPPGLTYPMQVAVGVGLLLLNGFAYTLLYRRLKRRA